MSILDATAKVSKPVPSHDRAHDVLRSERHPLDAIFAPRSVAVIGATERQGSIGRAVLWSLVSSPFGGTVYPVSDKRASVLGIKAYQRVADIPELVDLAVVVTPAATVPVIIGECVKEGVGEPNSRLHSGRNPCSCPPSLDHQSSFGTSSANMC